MIKEREVTSPSIIDAGLDPFMATIVQQFIDPSDTEVRSGSPTNNYVTATATSNIYNSGATGNIYLVPFNDYTPPVNNSVTKVELVIRKTNTTSVRVFSAYEVGPFDPNTVTWNTKPSFGSLIGSSQGTLVAVQRIDVTDWWLNAKANGSNGFAVWSDNTSNSAISTGNNGTDANKPYLEFTYDVSSIPVTVNVTPMTGSGLMTDPTVIITNPDVSINVAPMTGSALMNDATVIAKRSVSIPVDPMTGSAFINEVGIRFSTQTDMFADAGVQSGVIVNPTSESTNANAGGPDRRAIFRWNTPSQIVNPSQVVSASFTFTIASAASGYDINVYRITSPWDESTTTAPTIDTTSLAHLTGAGAETKTVDITQYAKDVSNGVYGNYGLAIYGFSPSGVIAISTREAATGKPSATYRYNAALVVNVSTNVDPMTADALITDVSVIVNSNARINVEPMTASAFMTEAIVVAPNVYIDVEAMTALASMPDPTVVAGTGVSVTVDGPMTASAYMTDAVVDLTTDIREVVPAMTATARMLTPASVNGIDIDFLEDPYYLQVQSTTDNDDIWYRFREVDGSAFVVDEKGADKNGKLFGNPVFTQGFANHRAMIFDGFDDYIQVPDRTVSDPALDPGSLEFYIKTDGKTQSIMTGRGYNSIRPGAPGTIGQYELVKVSDIDLVDGKIRITNRSEFYPDNPIVSQMMGSKDIADGKWHQVVLTTWWYPNRYDQGTVPRYEDVIDFMPSLGLSGITVFVDGKVDLRKTIGDPGSGTVVYIAQPDTIGRIGNSYFKGELSELVHRAYYSLPKYYIEQLKYAFFQDEVIRVEPMTATASSGDHKAKGNTKSILCLYFRDGKETFTGEGGYSPGLDKTWALDTGFNFQPKFGGMVGNPNSTNNAITPEDAIVGPAGAKIFFKSVYRDESAPAKPGVVRGYRDPITDELRYINLQTDIDVTEFDAIMFSDFPGVQYEVSNMPTRIRGQEFDKFIESLKVAVFDQGVNLYCAMPHVAEYLGIVDSWDAHIIKRDSFTIVSSSLVGLGGGDFESAYDDPFVNAEAYLDRETPARNQLAGTNYKYYYDTHTNSKHRIAAKIDGITDIPGYTLAEETYYRNPDYDYIQDLQYGARYEEHPIGVQIGDEFKFSGPLAQTDDYGRPGQVPWQDYNIISFKPEDINVGTILAKQQLMLNDGFSEFVNPQSDYATVIVVEPGSVLNGRTINGKIVIDSNDYYGFVTSALVQDLDSTAWENQWKDKENAITRQWQVSSRRVRTNTIKVSFTNNKVITGKNGAQAIVVETYSRELSQYGNVVSKPIRFVTMQERLWTYVLEAQSESADGDVKIRVEPMTASAHMVEPAIEGVSNQVIHVEPMRAHAEMTKIVGDESADETVYVFAMTASASMTNLTERVYAEPMVATAWLEEPFGMIFDSEDIIYVTLTRPGTITMIRNGDSQ